MEFEVEETLFRHFGDTQLDTLVSTISVMCVFLLVAKNFSSADLTSFSIFVKLVVHNQAKM